MYKTHPSKERMLCLERRINAVRAPQEMRVFAINLFYGRTHKRHERQVMATAEGNGQNGKWEMRK